MTDDEKKLTDDIQRVLQMAEVPLTQDAMTAIMALEHDVITSKALIGLLLKGEVDARFDGSPDDNTLDSDKYSFRKHPGKEPKH